jgi:hypothetical protein
VTRRGARLGATREQVLAFRLELTVEAFGSLPATARAAVEAEAQRLAPFRGAASAEVTVPA